MAFPVTCPACGKAFQLAAEIYERKVAGKVVSIKCKQCQAGIRVDATEPGTLKVVGATPAGGGDLSVGPKPPEAPKPGVPAAPKAAAPDAGAKPAAGAAPMRMRQPTLIGMMNPNAGAAKATAPAPAAPKAAAPPAPKPAVTPTPALWAVDSGGTGDDRELSEEEIRRELQAGNLNAQTLAWREGMGEWLEIGQIPELKGFLEAKTPEAPKAAPRVPERPAPPKAAFADFQDEPDGESTMVYDRSAPNAAFEPFAVPAELADTTARVRLDETAKLAEPPAPPPPPLPAAGRAAFAKTAPLGDAPPPPPPLAARPAPAAQPLPPPPAVRPPLPLQPAPPLQAAPPQRPPMPPPPVQEPPAPPLPKPVPAAAPALAAVPWGDALPSAQPAAPTAPALPTAYSRDPFAVAATTDLDFPQARSKKPLVIGIVVGVLAVIAIGIVVMSASGPKAANIAAPAAVPIATTAPETPKPAEPTPTSEPARNDSSDPVAPPSQPQTPNGNFSDLFSKGAEKAKGAGGGTKPFDEAAARASLSDALKAAAACKEVGGPTGQTSATVTFEPSGAVSGVTVGAPFAGSSVGTCIVTTFKRARVAPFTGLPGTVTQIISLR